MKKVPLLAVFKTLGIVMAMVAGAAQAADYVSPNSLVASPDGKSLYVASSTSGQLLIVDPATRKIIKSVSLPGAPNTVVATKNGERLFVTCAAPESKICVINAKSGKVTSTFTAGHTATGLTLSPDEKTLFVCNRFNNQIAVMDATNGKVRSTIAVPREPFAVAVTADGSTLYVANHLHDGAASADIVAAKVSIIDVGSAKVTENIVLPNGSGLLLDIKASPDGKYVAVTHLLSRFHLPTTQLERGWMNTDALTLIDTATRKPINTVLLDSVDSGAANPWGIAWSADSGTICVAHAGTHELSVIDAKALLEKLAKMPAAITNYQNVDYTAASRVAADVPNDLSFLVGVRKRVKLQGSVDPKTGVFQGGLGPRGVVMVGNKAYTANYFSDNIAIVEVDAKYIKPEFIALGSKKSMDVVRKGEFYFNDAGICFQGWQSCMSCHSFDARVDALNWDLLNDGIGNPKNSKSLLLSHKTPPAMSQGVRDSAEVAVRSGIRHILFTVQPDEVASSMDEWMKTLKPIPSPYLVKGKLSPAAQRGEKLFNSGKTTCAGCHPKELYTTLLSYDVGTKGQYDRTTEFDTPTMKEVWRTAPYMHDGSAATMKDVLTTHNKDDKHGHTKNLTPQQIDDLAEYVLSL